MEPNRPNRVTICVEHESLNHFDLGSRRTQSASLCQGLITSVWEIKSLMVPRAMDSFDFVEAVMVLEEVLEIEISDDEAEQCGSPREMVDMLEHHLSNQRPTKRAAELLRSIAKFQNNARLAEDLGGTWRREQIAAIVRESFGDRDSGSEGEGGSGIAVRNPKRPQTGSGSAAVRLDEENK